MPQHDGLVRPDQFAVDEFLPQAFADADDLLSAARGKSFGRGQQAFLESRSCLKPQTAQRVEPHRHAGQPGGQHAEQSRFGSPRVDDVRLQRSQNAAQFRERPHVCHRRDFTLDRDWDRLDLFALTHNVERITGSGDDRDVEPLFAQERQLAVHQIFRADGVRRDVSQSRSAGKGERSHG